MPRQQAVSVENNFIKGLITEATGLKFPENACTETFNCEFDHTGVVSRRLGLDKEDGYTDIAQSTANNAKAIHAWKNVAQEGDLSFVVVQNGLTLYFYQTSADEALSVGLHGDTVDLSSFLPAGGSSTSAATYECQFANANGKLVVTHPKLNSVLVEYDATGDNIAGTAITIRTRDLEGDLADTLYDPPDIATRPTSTLAALNASHRYNLENQGWTSTTLTSWDTARTDMPSNADVPWYFKSDTNPGSAYDFSLVANVNVGNSKAANGHFIYNLYDTDRATNVAGATESEIPLDRVSTCAFFAGRVWYGGLKYQGYNSKVFFSQIIEHEDQIGRCFSINDPTAELTSDALASDGGVIDLLEAGNIVKLIPIKNTLFVFCTNGVWAISGSTGTGFAANDFAVINISDAPLVSHQSFVRAEDSIYWWSHTGIYTIRKDPNTNALNVVNITNDTIKEFFEDIPLQSRELARGAYSAVDKRIQWLYKSTAASSFTEKYYFDRVLNLNLLTGAFYPWSINTEDSDMRTLGLIAVTGAGGAQVVNDVVAAAGVNNVQAGGGANEVVVIQSENTSIDEVIKFFVTNGTNVTWAEFYKDTYLDWESVDEDLAYSSYFITGYAVRGEGIRKFQQNYVSVFSDNSVSNSFTIRGLWGYTNNEDSGRWSNAQTFTNTAGDFDFKNRRVKIRGHGVACQLKFENNSTNPFNIIGWSVWSTGNASV